MVEISEIGLYCVIFHSNENNIITSVLDKYGGSSRKDKLKKQKIQMKA